MRIILHRPIRSLENINCKGDLKSWKLHFGVIHLTRRSLESDELGARTHPEVQKFFINEEDRAKKREVIVLPL